MIPDCELCGDTGWITCVDYDDSGYDIPCPEGCAGPVYTADDVFTQEVPF